MKNLLRLLIALCPFTAGAQVPKLVYDSNPGMASSSPGPGAVFNSKLYYAAFDTATGVRQLWSYDGSANPPVIAYRFITGFLPYNYSNELLAVFNGKLYFAADESALSGRNLMAYDGINPPARAAGIGSGNTIALPRILTVIGNLLYFSATYNGRTDNEPFVYDGINPPVKLDINPGSAPSFPDEFTGYNGKVYFSADGPAGYELYAYDPATGTFDMVADINPGTPASGPQGLVVCNSKLYFTAYAPGFGGELHSYDGTAVVRLTDIAPGNGFGAYGPLTVYNNLIYFAGSTNGTNKQLYRYDPATGNAALVQTINASGNADVRTKLVYNGMLYFTATDAATGTELWVYDGTAAHLVADLNPGSADGGISNMRLFNGALYMGANDGTSGEELYVVKGATGIQAAGFKASVAVLPNPTMGNVTLELSLDLPEACSISLTDAVGRAVWHKGLTAYPAGISRIPLPLSVEPSGVYYYRINNQHDILMAAGRTVKQ